MDKWDWQYAWDILPELLDGLKITFQATMLGSLLAFSLGLLFAVALRSRTWLVRLPVRAFVEFVRSTPLLVQVYFLFFVLDDFGIRFSALTTGIFALGVHYATYTAEVYRAGIDAVPRGQWEAARALDLPWLRTWTAVILPQAIPRVIPALGNYVISMFKETPLLIAIGVLDLVGQAREVGNVSFRYVEAYTLAGLLFLALSYPAALLVRRLERHVELRY